MRLPLPLISLLIAQAGCLPADDVKDDFAADFGQFSDEFGTGKADLFGLDIDPCELLGPIAEFGEDGLRSGFTLGIEGEGVLGVGVGFGGFDIVWDLYHQQMTVSKYAGAGLGSPGVGGSIQAYAGAAFGFEHGVADWDGYFVTAGTEIGLPFLKDYVSVNPGGYISAADENHDGLIGPNEVLAPPDGIYGFTVGVALGFDLLPDPLPIGGTVTEGYWSPYKSGIRHFYDQLDGVKMFFVEPLEVRLVDHHSGAECPADWPAVSPERDCVIEFGDPESSYLERAGHVAYSICHLAGRCSVPLAWPMSATALSIGALRSSGLSFSGFCSDSDSGDHH